MCAFQRVKDNIVVKCVVRGKKSNVVLSGRVMRAFRSSSTFSILKKLSEGSPVKPSIWILKTFYGYLLRTCEPDIFLALNTLKGPMTLAYVRLESKNMKSLLIFTPKEFGELMTNPLYMLPERIKFRRPRIFS
jgi:hypothetical protein